MNAPHLDRCPHRFTQTLRDNIAGSTFMHVGRDCAGWSCPHCRWVNLREVRHCTSRFLSDHDLFFIVNENDESIRKTASRTQGKKHIAMPGLLVANKPLKGVEGRLVGRHEARLIVQANLKLMKETAGKVPGETTKQFTSSPGYSRAAFFGRIKRGKRWRPKRWLKTVLTSTMDAFAAAAKQVGRIRQTAKATITLLTVGSLISFAATAPLPQPDSPGLISSRASPEPAAGGCISQRDGKLPTESYVDFPI